MAAAWGRRPHEVATGRLQVPGEELPVAFYLFDLACVIAWGRQEILAAKRAEAAAAALLRT